MQYEEIIRLLELHGKSAAEANRLSQNMCRQLLDEGGTLDRMRASFDQKLAILASNFSNEMSTLRDLITNDRLQAGRGSEPGIKLERPVSALVVDDDPMLCRTITAVLTDAGVSAYSAIDSEDALSLLRGEIPFDVVLVDLKMPRNGKGLAATILAEHPRVNVLLMSGNGGKAAREALALGAHGALGKPFDSNDALVLAVVRSADHRRLRVHGK